MQSLINALPAKIRSKEVSVVAQSPDGMKEKRGRKIFRLYSYGIKRKEEWRDG